MFWIDEAGLPMTGANIARAMQLSAPTVHEMVGRLIKDGYVERNPDKSLTFTEDGRERASYIVRRHRMIERFLTDVLEHPLGRGARGGGADRARDVAGAGGADARRDRRRHHLPARPPDRRGDPRARLAARRRRDRRRRRRPALRERGRGAPPLPDGRRPPAPASRARSPSPTKTTVTRRSGPPTATTPSPTALAERSRCAPIRRRPRAPRSPSSWSSAATATAA